MTSIYLAGKVSKNDWRHTVVAGLRNASVMGSPVPTRWPVLKKAVCGAFDYTGPYTMSCDHGCAHGGRHGCGDGQAEGPAPTREQLNALCLDAISRADVVFAWLDDPTAYGTLVEIGYARGIGKRVLVGAPTEPPDLWFAFASGTPFQAEHPAVALAEMIQVYERVNARTDSPVETAFWREHLRQDLHQLTGLVTQHKVGRYRLDFAIPDRLIGIEIDGYAYHSDKDAFVRDRARQRDLEADGWRIIRFAGSEVKANVSGCVEQAAKLATTR